MPRPCSTRSSRSAWSPRAKRRRRGAGARHAPAAGAGGVPFAREPQAASTGGVGEDALQLMTVHSSKARVRRRVPGATRKALPARQQPERGRRHRGRRPHVRGDHAARGSALPLYAGSRMLHGQPRYGIVSRFVEEIPAELCKWIRAAGQNGLGGAAEVELGEAAWAEEAEARRIVDVRRRTRPQGGPKPICDSAARQLRDLPPHEHPSRSARTCATRSSERAW